MLLEGRNDLPPQGRGHVVRDEALRTQILNLYPLLSRQRMIRVDHQRQFIRVDSDRFKRIAFGTEREDANFHRSLQEIVRDPAGQRTLNADSNLWTQAPK